MGVGLPFCSLSGELSARLWTGKAGRFCRPLLCSHSVMEINVPGHQRVDGSIGVATTARIRSRPSVRGSARQRSDWATQGAFDARIVATSCRPQPHGFLRAENLVLPGLRVGHEVLHGQANLPCAHDGHGVPRQSSSSPSIPPDPRHHVRREQRGHGVDGERYRENMRKMW